MAALLAITLIPNIHKLAKRPDCLISEVAQPSEIRLTETIWDINALPMLPPGRSYPKLE